MEGKEEAFIEYFGKNLRLLNKHVYFKCGIAEGNYEVLHCYQEQSDDGSSNNWADIDILWLDEKGKNRVFGILQRIPEISAINNNTMFKRFL